MISLYNESMLSTIDTIINALNLLTFCVPAILFFIYHQFSVIEIWEKYISEYGTTLYIHNKAKCSIYIAEVTVKCTCAHNWGKCPETDFKPMVLKSDEHEEIIINYAVNPSQTAVFTVEVCYNRHRRKRVKVYVRN